MKHTYLFLIFLISASPSIWACSFPPANNSYYTGLNKQPATMMLSSNGQYLMKIIPSHFARTANGDWKEDRISQGIAYKITRQGTLKQLWTIKNITPQRMAISGDYYLADDGVHLVKVSQAKDVHDKSALVIYNRGQLFRNYAPITFMPFPKKFRTHSCGSGSWISYDYQSGRRIGIDLVGRNISFKTADGKPWSFDIRRPPK